jgi:selenocysteine lyase/cysteine desulfurase
MLYVIRGMTNPLNYRDEFLITRKFNYLDNAGLSPLPTSVIEASNQFMHERSRIGAMNYFDSWEGMRNRVAEGFGKLIGAHPDELAFTKNTHEGINMVANMIQWKQGDNMVLNDLEFPANVFPWTNQRGVEVRVAENRDGLVHPDEISKLVDENTRAVSLSHVSFMNGFRQDLEAVGRVARENDAFFVVDAMQSVGCIELNVRDCYVDFLACGGHKWLLSPLGTGFFYIRRELIDNFHPPSIGLQGHDSGLLIGFTKRWNPHNTARKFMTGNISYSGFAGMERGLEIIHDIGLRNIQKRNQKLTQQIVEELYTEGLRWKTPLELKYRSPTMTFTTPNIEKVYQHLNKRNIVTAPRWSGLRVSPNFYNTEDEITELCDVVNKLSS